MEYKDSNSCKETPYEMDRYRRNISYHPPSSEVPVKFPSHTEHPRGCLGPSGASQGCFVWHGKTGYHSWKHSYTCTTAWMSFFLHTHTLTRKEREREWMHKGKGVSVNCYLTLAVLFPKISGLPPLSATGEILELKQNPNMMSWTLKMLHLNGPVTIFNPNSCNPEDTFSNLNSCNPDDTFFIPNSCNPDYTFSNPKSKLL